MLLFIHYLKRHKSAVLLEVKSTNCIFCKISPPPYKIIFKLGKIIFRQRYETLPKFPELHREKDGTRFQFLPSVTGKVYSNVFLYIPVYDHHILYTQHGVLNFSLIRSRITQSINSPSVFSIKRRKCTEIMILNRAI